jgi:hypothetical protein
MPKLKDFITAENELDGQEYAYISQTDKTRKTTIQKIKDFILGPAVLTTNDKTMRGAVNEVNAQLSEKANKNWIINGNLDFWQRGSSATGINATAKFLPDRFACSSSITSQPLITWSKQSLIPGEIDGATFFSRIDVDGAGTFSASDYMLTMHSIENGTRKLCGANKKITISFWARSNIANKKIGVYAIQKYGTGGTPTLPEPLIGKYFTLSTSWKKYSLTLDTNTLIGKTFGTNNDDYLRLVFLHGYGPSQASNISDTVAETFRSAGYIDMAQIKLESGDKATPFVPKDPSLELTACQRYGEPLPTPFYAGINNGYVCNNTYKVTKRATPTLSFKSVNNVDGKLSWYNGTAWVDTTIASTDWTYSNGYSFALTATGISGTVLVQGNVFADAEIY